MRKRFMWTSVWLLCLLWGGLAHAQVVDLIQLPAKKAKKAQPTTMALKKKPVKKGPACIHTDGVSCHFWTQCWAGSEADCQRLLPMYKSFPHLRKEYKAYVTKLKTSCNKSSDKDCVTVSMLYRMGIGQPVSLSKAFGWSFIRCKRHDKGCKTLPKGLDKALLESGKDDSGKVKLLKMLCTKKLGYACLLMGLAHERGRYQSRTNLLKAIPYFKKACLYKNSFSCHYIGALSSEGLGMEQDEKVARAHFAKACMLKNGRSCLELAKTFWGFTDRYCFPARLLHKQACEYGAKSACAFTCRPSLDAKTDLFAKYQVKPGGPVGRLFLSSIIDVQHDCAGKKGRACTLLGWLSRQQIGGTKDESEANRVFEQACTLGDPEGCILRGRSYRLGLGEKVAPEKAREWFEKSCALKDGFGCFVLGQWWAQKAKDEKDKAAQEKAHKKSEEVFSKACKAGHVHACSALAASMLKRAPKKATSMLHSSCQKGDALGCYLWVKRKTGVSHEALVISTLSSSLQPQVLSALKVACKGNERRACYVLGRHFKGQPEQQKYFFRRACWWGEFKACHFLARTLEREGQVHNEAEIRSLYQKACRSGSKRSCSIYAKMCFHQQGGKCDASSTHTLLEEGCSLKAKTQDAQSCFLLGERLQKGVYTLPDQKKAQAYFSLACKLGWSSGCGALALGQLRTNPKQSKAQVSLEKACLKGDLRSCAVRAGFILGDLTTTSERKQWIEIFTKKSEAACKRSPKACVWKGVGLLQKNTAPKEGVEQAVELLKKVCDLMVPEACWQLAKYMDKQKDKKKKTTYIHNLYKRGCRANDGPSCAHVAGLYHRQKIKLTPVKFSKIPLRRWGSRWRYRRRWRSGWDRIRSEKLAKKHFEKACQLGHGDSCIGVGDVYRYEKASTHKESKAYRYYKKACLMGSGKGCASLGFFLRTPLDGKTADKEAREAFALSCKLRDAVGCGKVGSLMEEGVGGQKQASKALAMFEQACALKSANYCRLVAVRLSKGPKRDCAKANAFFKKACALGSWTSCSQKCVEK